MSILDQLMGYQGDHPKDVAKAYHELSQQISKSEGSTEEQQWREHFQDAKIAGVSPGQVYNPESGQGFKPEGTSELDRWKNQIDGLIQSGNPVLQKQGLDMISQYRSRATSPEASQPAMSTAGKMAVEMGLRPGTKAFNDFVQSYAFKTNRQYAPKYVTPSEAKSLRWLDKDQDEPIVGQEWEQIRGRVKTIDDAAGMRDSAGSVLDTMEQMLWNEEDGIYRDPVWQGSGASGVIAGGLTGAIQDITQSNPKYKAFGDLRAGSAAQIVRAMGEKGALSDKDIERALNLLPNVSGARGMPDLPETAKLKMKYLRIMLDIDPSQWGALLNAAESDLESIQEPASEEASGSDWEDK